MEYAADAGRGLRGRDAAEISRRKSVVNGTEIRPWGNKEGLLGRGGGCVEKSRESRDSWAQRTPPVWLFEGWRKMPKVQGFGRGRGKSAGRRMGSS